jgi:hypothetical protein
MANWRSADYTRAMDRPLGAPATVRIGNAQAVCPGCGGGLFAQKRVAPRLYSDVCVCIACERETTRAELVQQLAGKVSAKAQRVLDELKARRAREQKD